MPLLIHVRKGKKIFMNGAVLENASERTITFLLKNKAEILRCDDILVPDEAVTPASRIYYALQCLYLFPDSRGQCFPVLFELAESYREAAPSASELVERMFTAVRAKQYYDGLKLARELIAHESRCLQRLDRGLAGTDGNEAANLKAPLVPAVALPREAAASKPRKTLAG
jgi:flagellar biosynthesis repressor protein FlbT